MPLMISNIKESEIHQTDLYKDLKNDEAAESNITFKTEKLREPDTKYLNQSSARLQDESNHISGSEEFDEDLIVETTALKHASEPSKSSSDDAVLTENYLTVPGTIKRGKKKAQSVEVVLNMSREELEILELNITTKKGFICNTKNGVGLHVLLWTILCFPFSIIISGVHSFYMGTITWYNIFKFFSENKAVAYRILFPPLLIILYPFLIISISLGLGLYAGVRQLTCCWNSWVKEFTDYEKGFYGWLCNTLDIPECSPYEKTYNYKTDGKETLTETVPRHILFLNSNYSFGKCSASADTKPNRYNKLLFILLNPMNATDPLLNSVSVVLGFHCPKLKKCLVKFGGQSEKN